MQNVKGRECEVMLIKVSAIEKNANSGLPVQPQDMRRGETCVSKVKNFQCIQTLSCCVIQELLDTSTLQNKFCLSTPSKIKIILHYV